MDPVDVLRRLGGIAAHGELIGATTRGRLRRAVADGRVVRLRHNRYALVDTDAARMEAVAAGGSLSHLSAAQWWGWKVKVDPERPVVTVPKKGRRPTSDVEVRWADLDHAEIHRNVTRPVRTVIDCARTLPFDEALAVADSALRDGDVEPHELMLAADRAPRIGRIQAIRVIETANGKSANPFESVIRAIALDVPGLDVVPQGEVPGVGFVDLLDRRLGLVIEAESFEFHGTKAGLRRDVVRYTELTRRGFMVIRFLWEEAMFDPTRVRDVLLDAVRVRSACAGHHHVGLSPIRVDF